MHRQVVASALIYITVLVVYPILVASLQQQPISVISNFGRDYNKQVIGIMLLRASRGNVDDEPLIENTRKSSSVDLSRRRSSRLAALNETKDVANGEIAIALKTSVRNGRTTKRSCHREVKIDSNIDDSFPYKFVPQNSVTATTKRSRKNREDINNTIAMDGEPSAIDLLTTASVSNPEMNPCVSKTKATTLPRKLEESIRQSHPNVEFVLGIDEAGRGPLAGPVVIGGIRMVSNTVNIVEGVTDSKKIVSESQREILYEQLIQSLTESSACTGVAASDNPNDKNDITWAIAIIDAATIDEINILQATMLGMQLVAAVLTGQSIRYPIVNVRECTLSSQSPRNGCYVIVGNDIPSQKMQQPCDLQDSKIIFPTSDGHVTDTSKSKFYALVDGNRVPSDMPCPADAIVKGDGREYCIAAASILAKVTRDRIMHRYHEQYPMYNLAQHKGYPTKAHFESIRIHGPSPIHRLSFAPLKNKQT